MAVEKIKIEIEGTGETYEVEIETSEISYSTEEAKKNGMLLTEYLAHVIKSKINAITKGVYKRRFNEKTNTELEGIFGG